MTRRSGSRRTAGGQRGHGGRSSGRPARPRPARAVALDALDRIDEGGAYANLVLPGVLDRSGLAPADRRFVTDLVYGTTRMRRACDHLVDGYVDRPLDARVRNALRLGAYQLAFAGVPPHAAVGETVGVAPRPARGLVNAVLRRVAAAPAAVAWPDDATRLSVPDWVLDELIASLGGEVARAALATMNEPATVSARDDGYVQDPASQQVAAVVGARPGERVLDLCAAPGGKATALAAAGATVVAADVRHRRTALLARNARHVTPGAAGAASAGSVTGGPVPGGRSSVGSVTGARAAGTAPGVEGRVVAVTADGARPPWREGAFDRVLVDAPCSGLGTLRRRPDLRWRIETDAVGRLAGLQRRLLAAAAGLVRPGGTLVYSVCTLTAAETTGVDEWLATTRPDLVPTAPPAEPWRRWGRGAMLLPQAAGTDGMCLFRYVRRATDDHG